MKKILLIGSGAREHAIAETLKRSKHHVHLTIFGSAKNPGMTQLADHYEIGSLSKFDKNDFSGLEELIKKLGKFDFAISGPEAPLAAGVTDFLAKLNIPTIGPSKKLAQLEASKSFTRDLLKKYNIAGNPDFKVFHAEKGIREYMEELKGNFVVKLDGLKGGKGVKVSGEHLEDIEAGILYAKECLKECGKVVIEEKLIGQEFSLMSLTDGKTVLDLPAVQDHKRAFENDEGPNTGGMGSYSDANHSLPFLKDEDLKEAHEITEKVAKALYEETGEYFKGIMYGGFMVTRNGIKLIEYNVRFGDPEAMNVLPVLQTDLVEICEAIINGTLSKFEKLHCENKATVCKYAVPEGYPDNPVKNVKIKINEMPAGVKVYYASVDQKEDGLYLGGSRAVAVVGIADNLVEAEYLAEKGIIQIEGPVFHRTDIGTEGLIHKKVKMMEGLRK